MDLVDSILIFISAQDSLPEFSVADIMTQQEGEIKQIYNESPIIEFGLQYIAEKSPTNPAKFVLDPEKVRKFAG